MLPFDAPQYLFKPKYFPGSLCFGGLVPRENSDLASFLFVTSESDIEANGRRADSTNCMKKGLKREEERSSRSPCVGNDRGKG